MPEKSRTATARIELRVTPVDKARVIKLAKKAGLTVTGYLLQCALGRSR